MVLKVDEGDGAIVSVKNKQVGSIKKRPKSTHLSKDGDSGYYFFFKLHEEIANSSFSSILWEL